MPPLLFLTVSVGEQMGDVGFSKGQIVMVVARIPGIAITHAVTVIWIGVISPRSTIANIRLDDHRLKFAVLGDDHVTDVAVVGVTLEVHICLLYTSDAAD